MHRRAHHYSSVAALGLVFAGVESVSGLDGALTLRHWSDAPDAGYVLACTAVGARRPSATAEGASLLD